MTRIVAIGHAALDRIYRVEKFPAAPTKIRALEHIETGGGMAANAAATIARLGGEVELWSRIGDDDNGVKVRRGLTLVGVDARYVQSFDNNRTSTSVILVDGAGERLIVSSRDVDMPSSTEWLPLERVSGAGAVLADLRWIEGVRAVFQAARAAGIATVLDADLGGREAIGELMQLTDHAIFSAPALEEFVSAATMDDRLRHVADMGPRHVGVTLGAGGYAWIEDGAIGAQKGFRVEVVDTTGAGDAFHGAYAQGLVQHRKTQDNVRRACAVAAIKCTRLGGRAGLPSAAEVDAFLMRH
ncbi:MAG: PfkB family carbohydrate kinase [Hyphomicrobiaceae bacterium]